MNTKGNIAPTQTKITELKHSTVLAQNASSMLYKKAQVFEMYLKDYAKKLETNTELLENVMKEAFIKLAVARYSFAGANLSAFAEQMVGQEACIKVNSYVDRFLGNALFFTMVEYAESDIWPLAGLSKGGESIMEAKKIFRKAAEVLVGQITLQSVFMALFKAKELNMRKSMVITKIVIPNIQNLITYIRNYLDDMERDDMYRYKLVKRRKSMKEREKFLERQQKNESLLR